VVLTLITYTYLKIGKERGNSYRKNKKDLRMKGTHKRAYEKK
jgi:hypothetical protein